MKSDLRQKKNSCTIISVIIPTFKPGLYIEECIKSISKQTLDSKSFEVILVINGCNEPWTSIIKALVSKYLSHHRVVVFQTDISGVSNARNIALDLSSGEYITFIDDDDFISPSYLEELLEKSSVNCVGISDSIYFEDKTGRYESLNIHHTEFLKLKKMEHPSVFLSRRFFNGPVMKLVHRSIIGSRRFDIRFHNGEDSLFMALITDRIREIKLTTSSAVYYRRIRENSATTTHRSFKLRSYNCFLSILTYSKYWLKSPFNYNPIFMLSRIIASIKSLILNR